MPSPLQSWTRWRQAAGFCCAVAVCTPGVAQPPTEPLHAQIDHLIEASLTPPVAPLSGDAEFLRRVSLDLAGTIPTAEEARAFLDDPSPGKRASVVDSLVSSKQFARHMTDTFDLLLMERQPSQKIEAGEWRKFLYQSFLAHNPLDQLIREILDADGSDGPHRPASRFYLDRAGEPHALTQAVGRIFFAKDMQCAQCHDHPLVDDYGQSDYYGLFAYFRRSELFLDSKDGNKAYMAERADGEASYFSVFDSQKSSYHALPQLPGGRPIVDPATHDDQAYEVAPADGVRAIPRYSRRAALAEAATGVHCRALRRNLANRLWAHMMGRGLVEPVDMDHGDNPPTYPRLLDLLTEELAVAKFDLRFMLREIALTKAYGRSCQLPKDLTAVAAVDQAQTANLQAEHARWSEVATESERTLKEIRAAWSTANQALAKTETLRQEAREQSNSAAKTAQDAATEEEEACQTLATSRELATALTEAATKARQAAEKLPTDEELTAAAQTFVTRSQDAASVATEAEKTLAEKETAARQATQALETARNTLSEREAKYRKLAQQYSDASQLLATVKRKCDLDRALVAQAARRLADAEARAEFAKTHADLDLAETEAAAAMQRLTATLRRLVAARKNHAATLEARLADIAQAQAAVDTALSAVRQLHQTVAARRDDLAQRWTVQTAIIPLKPLRPEQLARSMMQATGWIQVRRVALTNTWKPEGGDQDTPPDSNRDETRSKEVESKLQDDLQATVGQFISRFATGVGASHVAFQATVDQALFLSNGGELRSWLTPQPGNLVDRLHNLKESRALADELYLSVLTRRPTQDEVANIKAYLADCGDGRTAATQELVWALLTSTEFRFNH